MATKEQMKAKAKAAADRAAAGASAAPKNTTNMSVGTTFVPNLYSIIGEYHTKWNFGKEILSLEDILSEKLQFLMFGKPLIIDYDSENEEDETSEIVTEIELQETLFAAEKDNFNDGHSIFIVEPLGKGKVQLRLADPNFPNVIKKQGKIVYEAVVWTAFKFEFAQYWKRTTYNEDYIYQDVYSSSAAGDFADKKPIKVDTLNNRIASKALKIKPKMKNPYGIIPVVQIPYVPTRDYSVNGLKSLAPKKRLEGLQVMLDEAFTALRKELLYNSTRTLIDADLLDANGKEKMAQLMKMGIWAVLNDSGNVDGENKQVEVLMGDPKIASYWENITNIISLAVQTLKLSELTSEDSTTATDAIFSKGNDVETVNALSTFRQAKISEIVEKARIIKEGESSTEVDLDVSKWSIQITPNVIMNEAKLTDMIIKQLGAGLVNMVQAKVKLENISKKDAENSLNEDDGQLNPTLDSIMSFGDDGGGDAKDDKPAGKENTPTPE